MTRRPTYEELERRIKELEKEAGKRKEAEEVLRKYQFMIESANDAIFLKDLGSRYITANDKTLGVFGLSREGIIGKNDYELMPDQKEAKKNVHDDQIVFKSGKPKEVFKHMTGADGKKYWFQAIKVPQFDNDGTSNWSLVKSIDNSSRLKTIVKTLNILGQEVDSSYSGIVFYIYSNGTSEKSFQ